MRADRRRALIIGVLFIVASVTAIVGGSLLASIDDPGYLADVAADEGTIVTGALLELILVLSVVGIAVCFYPILRRRTEGAALGYVGARTLEATLLLAAAVSALLVLRLGQSHLAGASGLQPVGDSVLAARELTYTLGSLVALGISALILNALLLRSRLVPVWLSIWGLVGGGAVLVRGVLEVYGLEFSGAAQAALAAPIGVQEMVLAVLLIVCGFSRGTGLADEADRLDRVGLRGGSH